MIMFEKQTKVWLCLTIVLSLLALASACSKTAEGPSENAGAPTGKAFAPKGNEGTVTGVVAFNGTPPAPKKIDASADAVCQQKNPNLVTEDTVVNNGKLANAFVYIKDGTTAGGTKITEFSFKAPSEPVVLDQNGCHYRPHVLGIQTGQTLKVTNSDPTQHNIHPTPKNNPEWNQTQPNGAAPIEKTFARAEVLIPVKCNQHPWMRAYIGAIANPSVPSGVAAGAFRIRGMASGEYSLAAWTATHGNKTSA
jgi:plastocyanin